MSAWLSRISLFVGLAALVLCVLDRRAAGTFPIVMLLRDRYGKPRGRELTAGLWAGVAVILLPVVAFTLLGWVHWERGTSLSISFLLLAIPTLGLKLVWAATEELIFRGAVLPRVARFTGGPVALLLSALLFAWGHLARTGARAPDALSTALFVLDGLGFGLAYLGTRSLWMPTLWHAAKNISIWLLFGAGTFQFVSGPLQVVADGPVLWTGSGAQAGLADLAVTLSVVLAVLAVYGSRIAAGWRWVQDQ